jgi:polysaccharide pyruvyl transferase WcaK-like protein
MKIAHFYSTSQNLGDLGSALGIRKLLSALEPALIFNAINLDTKHIYPPFGKRNQFARKHTGLIVGGGGHLYQPPKRVAKWNFNVPLKYFSQIQIPKVIYGIGLNKEFTNAKRWHMSYPTIEAIRKYAEACNLVGVRDLQSVQFMEEIGVRNVRLTPCPSMFLGCHESKTDNSHRHNRIALNLTTRGVSVLRLEKMFSDLIQQLKTRAITPVVILNNPAEDAAVTEMAKAYDIECISPYSPDAMMMAYQNTDLSIGMRGHSLIFTTGAGNPMIALSYNLKCDAHMEMIEKTEYLIKGDNIFDVALIIQKLDQILAGFNAEKAHIQKKKAEFYALNTAFGRDIIAILQAFS